MKKTAASLFALVFCLLATAQTSETQHLVDLGKAYKNFMFRNEAPNDVAKSLRSGSPATLATATEFIIQTLTNKNKLLSSAYLTRPDEQVLKQVYIVDAIYQNLDEEDAADNSLLIDSLKQANIPAYELVDNYYGMLFTAVGNKNQPFDLSKADLRLKEYNLKDDTERGIVFLRCFNLCNRTIWGFMNIVKPPNTEKAYAEIKKFPKVNGQPYYQYSDFYFADFEMTITTSEGPQSYKSYYLNRFYEILLNHLICLDKEGAAESEIHDLLLGSILKEKKLYKYTKFSSVLEGLFEEQKQD